MARQIVFDTWELSNLNRILEHEKERVYEDYKKNKITHALFKMKVDELEVLRQRIMGKDFQPNYQKVKYESKIRRAMSKDGEEEC